MGTCGRGRPGNWGRAVFLFLALGTSSLQAQDLPPTDVARFRSMTGAELYEDACANCHGTGGAGALVASLELPVAVPDFTDCSFASREPDADWIGIALAGGPSRGFDPMMPAFHGVLIADDLQRVMDHIRTFCTDPSWPRGELNLPRAMLTEKAYPEDEWVWEIEATGGQESRSVLHEVIYEKRIGSRSQVEFIVPFGVREQGVTSEDGWAGGLGDIGIGLKHTLYHSVVSGSILSAGGEVVLPTGKEETGFGGNTTVLESFLSFGQILPSDAFFQLQGIAEFPTGAGHDPELVARGVIGRTFTTGELGRAWSPMLEFQGKRELEDGVGWEWDFAPQFQVTLNTRQHIMLNVALIIPLTERSERPNRLAVYLLWDWFDGGLRDGW